MKRTIRGKLQQGIDIVGKVFVLLLLFCVSIVIISPLVGTLFELFGLEWGWVAVALTFILSALIAGVLQKESFLAVGSAREFAWLVVLMAGAVLIYTQYSPVLELRQDPSVYMLKAMNLVNYGHLYSPASVTEQLCRAGILDQNNLEGYAMIQNGTEYMDGRLYVDFYPGGTFFYAIVGLFSKQLIFYAQSLIMVLNVVLFYFVIRKLASKQMISSKIVLTAIFFIAPIIVWFGRGSFSEPFALFFVLLLINFLLHEKLPIWLTALAFCASYSSRIDYLLLLLIGVFIITFLSKRAGILFTLAAVVEIFIFKEVYFIYYNRITTQDMPVLKYGLALLAVALVISLIIAQYGKEWIQKIYYSKVVQILFALAGMGCTLLMFRDNIISEENYEYAEMHGRVIRTYAEEILDLLSLVFPSFILVAGLLGIVYFIRRKEIPFLASVFMLGITTVYLYFLLAAGNSPQLYWMLRRYYNVILPMLFFAFVLALVNIQKKTMLIISAACFLISTNMFLDSGQIPDYEGLDDSVRKAETTLRRAEANVVFYDQELRYEVSSLMSYDMAEFIPVDMSNEQQIGDILDWIQDNVETNTVWLLGEKYVADADDIDISFAKMGEAYGEIPKEIYDTSYKMYMYRSEDFLTLEEDTQSVIYPNIRVSSCEGFYDDGEWMDGALHIETSDMTTEGYNKLYVKMYNYENFYLDNDNEVGLDLTMLINGQEVKLLGIDHNCAMFDISRLNVEIHNVEVKCNTFNQVALEVGEDDRDLGIAVETIYME